MPQDKLIIFDTTLRDGEQAPGIALTPDEKLAIARQLAKLNVDVIEAGFAAASDGDFFGVQQIAKEVRGPVIASLARCTPGDIDRAFDAVKHAERHRIHVFQSTSPIHMESMLRMTPDEVMASIVEGVRRARTYTDDVEFSPQDATRSDVDFLLATCTAAVAEGATTINIPEHSRFRDPPRLRRTAHQGLRRGIGWERRRDHLHALSQRPGPCGGQFAVGDPCRSTTDRRCHQWDRRAGRQHIN